MKFDATALADTTEPRRLWRAGPHGTALPALRHAIARGKPLALLTGESGVGKTIGINALAQQLADDGLTVARIAAPVVDAVDLRAAIGLALGHTVGATRDDLVAAAGEWGRLAIVIDDAQAVSDAALAGVGELLQTISGSVAVLAGPDTLAARLATPAVGVLARVVPVTRRLRPLAETETELFIEHLLKNAGASYDAIAPEIMRSIWRTSGGIPRVILHLCRHTLESAAPPDRAQLRRWTEGVSESPATVEDATTLPGVVMLNGGPAAPARSRWRIVAIAAAVVAVLATAVLAAWPTLRHRATASAPQAPVGAPPTRAAVERRPVPEPAVPASPTPEAAQPAPADVVPSSTARVPTPPPVPKRDEAPAPAITSTSAPAAARSPTADRRSPVPAKASSLAARPDSPARPAAATPPAPRPRDDRGADAPDPTAVIDWLLKER